MADSAPSVVEGDGGDLNTAQVDEQFTMNINQEVDGGGGGQSSSLVIDEEITSAHDVGGVNGEIEIKQEKKDMRFDEPGDKHRESEKPDLTKKSLGSETFVPTADVQEKSRTEGVEMEANDGLIGGSTMTSIAQQIGFSNAVDVELLNDNHEPQVRDAQLAETNALAENAFSVHQSLNDDFESSQPESHPMETGEKPLGLAASSETAESSPSQEVLTIKERITEQPLSSPRPLPEPMEIDTQGHEMTNEEYSAHAVQPAKLQIHEQIQGNLPMAPSQPDSEPMETDEVPIATTVTMQTADSSAYRQLEVANQAADSKPGGDSKSKLEPVETDEQSSKATESLRTTEDVSDEQLRNPNSLRAGEPVEPLVAKEQPVETDEQLALVPGTDCNGDIPTHKQEQSFDPIVNDKDIESPEHEMLATRASVDLSQKLSHVDLETIPPGGPAASSQTDTQPMEVDAVPDTTSPRRETAYLPAHQQLHIPDQPLISQPTELSRQEADPMDITEESNPEAAGSAVSEESQSHQPVTQQMEIDSHPSLSAASHGAEKRPLNQLHVHDQAASSQSAINAEEQFQKQTTQPEPEESEAARLEREEEDGYVANFLSPFTSTGIPLDDMGHMIVQKASDGLASVLRFTKSLQRQHDGQIAWLCNELQKSKDANVALMADFEKYKKSKGQKEIRLAIEETKEELKKLRAPDVTLEEMKEEIRILHNRVHTSEKKYEEAKNIQKAEATKLKDLRVTFSREAKSHGNNRKDDLKELKIAVDDLQADVQSIYQELDQKNDQPSTPGPSSTKQTLANADSQGVDIDAMALLQEELAETRKEVQLATQSHERLQNNLDVLRNHVTEMVVDERDRDLTGIISFPSAQRSANKAVFDALRSVKENVTKTWKFSSDIAEKVNAMFRETQCQSRRVDHLLNELQNRVGLLEEKVKRKESPRTTNQGGDDDSDSGNGDTHQDTSGLEEDIQRIYKELSTLQSQFRERNVQVDQQFDEIHNLVREESDCRVSMSNEMESEFRSLSQRLALEKKDRIRGDFEEVAQRAVAMSILARHTNELWSLFENAPSTISKWVTRAKMSEKECNGYRSKMQFWANHFQRCLRKENGVQALEIVLNRMSCGEMLPDVEQQQKRLKADESDGIALLGFLLKKFTASQT